MCTRRSQSNQRGLFLLNVYLQNSSLMKRLHAKVITKYKSWVFNKNENFFYNSWKRQSCEKNERKKKRLWGRRKRRKLPRLPSRRMLQLKSAKVIFIQYGDVLSRIGCHFWLTKLLSINNMLNQDQMQGCQMNYTMPFFLQLWWIDLLF